jgi:hypothetical protein
MNLNNTNIPDNVANAIIKASKIGQVDPGFMFAMAKQESGFNPNAHAPTSSATGLYQFIKSTWNKMVDMYGKQYGIGYSDIKDPSANAIMGALYARDNKNNLESSLGIKADPTDMYFAHFLGVDGAKKFLSGAMKDNSQPAVNLVSPGVASANKSIFYDKSGKPRSAKDVYELFDQKVGAPARNFSLALNSQPAVV